MKNLTNLIAFTLITFFNILVYSQADLSSIYFTDANTGYTVGQRGTILKTINGGVDWIAQTNGVSVYLTSVYFTNANTGYAVGNNTILKTIDGGITWIKNEYHSGYDNWALYSVFFPDIDTGYVTGTTGTFLKTTDAGENWTEQTAPGFNDNLHSAYFTGTNTGYVPAACDIFKTTNGGDYWNKQTFGINLNYRFESIYFININTGYAVGDGGIFFKTVNAGTKWTELTKPTTKSLFSVYFTDTLTGYAVGLNGTILKTINGGENWQTQISGTNEILRSILFTDISTGYSVGDNGIILKTTDGGDNWVKQTIPTSVILFNTSNDKPISIFPNPSSGNFTLEFDNPNKNILKISITNMAGKTLFETSITQEKYEFSEKVLPKGIYFVKVIGDKVNFGKIIVR
jgi:photosystem II stability/assembly factor-like uncharacterized protein